MAEYSPKNEPEIVVQYTIAEPGQHGTRNQEELDPMIDIDGILFDGVSVPPWAFDRQKPIYEKLIIEFLRCL